MKKCFNKIVSLILCYTLFSSSLWAVDQVKVRNLVLPSEVQKLPKTPGSVYYGTGPKSGALMPINVWGEVRRSGLYYVPVNSTIIQGLSLAGGTTSQSDLSEVKVSRQMNGKVSEEELDLSEGGDQGAYHYKLRSGDTIFVAKDTHMQDRAFYTSLVSVVFTLLSTIVLFKKIDDN